MKNITLDRLPQSHDWKIKENWQNLPRGYKSKREVKFKVGYFWETHKYVVYAREEEITEQIALVNPEKIDIDFWVYYGQSEELDSPADVDAFMSLCQESKEEYEILFKWDRRTPNAKIAYNCLARVYDSITFAAKTIEFHQ